MSRPPTSPAAPTLSRIVIFPIKALDGVQVSEVSIRSSGGLAGDRELAMFDASGQVVNGKRHARVHSLRAEYDLGARAVSLSAQGRLAQFDLGSDRAQLEAWLAGYFGFAVHLRQDTHRGFPDDRWYF